MIAQEIAIHHPERVRSLSLHSTWDRSDAYLKTCVETWRSLAQALPTVADMVIQGIFPFCFTPEMYAERPEYVDALVDFVRSRMGDDILDAFGVGVLHDRAHFGPEYALALGTPKQSV